jgi:RND family efflux transporter MFP subunit
VKNKRILFIGLVIILMLGACKEEGLDIGAESSIPVKVEPVELKPIKEYVTATGTVYAIQEALLKSEQSGYYVLQKNPRTGSPFAMGDRVRKGELLVSLENQEFVNQTAIVSKKLNHEVSKWEHEKQKAIYEKGGITLRELTDAERAYIDAKYSFENAKIALDKLRIVASFDGLIVDLPYYSPNQWIESNSPVVQLMDYSQLYADVTLPRKEMSNITRGQQAEVTSYGITAQTLPGTVTQVSPALDPESRMFKLRVVALNKNLLFKPGTFVKLDIVVKQKDSALVIPKEIILDRRGIKTVFIVQRGIAIERRLRTGMSSREEIEVLEGLKQGDSLVVEGFETLRHRSKVKVIQ